MSLRSLFAVMIFAHSSFICGYSLFRNSAGCLRTQSSCIRRFGTEPKRKAERQKVIPEERVLYVVAFHYHKDYPKGESYSGVAGVYENICPALKLCIAKNVKYHDEIHDLSETLMRRAGFKTKEAAEEHERSDVCKRLLGAAESLKKAATIKNIHDEILSSLDEREPKYSLQAHGTIYNVHEMSVNRQK